MLYFISFGIPAENPVEEVTCSIPAAEKRNFYELFDQGDSVSAERRSFFGAERYLEMK